ncbi:TIGR01777 family oxidoreductase [bacterium]|nr:TIGR01777 family oxidoreductase [bacterium]
MPTFTYRSTIPASADELYQWHMREGAIERLTPPWSSMQVTEGRGHISDESRRVLRVPAGPLRIKWVARHHSFIEGRQFCDEQISGPFKKWIHTHRFIPTADGQSILEDSIDYELPFSAVGRLLGESSIRRINERVFPWRHQRTIHDLKLHSRFADKPRLRVAITGASGLIGSNLMHFLTTGGHEVFSLVRRQPNPALREVYWNPSKGEIDSDALEGMDAVIHLAGKNIAGGRWTESHLREVRESRIKGTRLIAKTVAELNAPPAVLISASAIGYYGSSDTEEFTEESAPGQSILSGICEAWESAAEPARRAGIRVVHPRIGVVLSASGGTLKKLLPFFKLGLGVTIGNGKQPMSWILLDDLIAGLFWILGNEALNGPINMTSPYPVNNKMFTRILGQFLCRPAILIVPSRLLHIMLGKMADELLLSGANVSPRKLIESGFNFSYPKLATALQMELGKLDKWVNSP